MPIPSRPTCRTAEGSFPGRTHEAGERCGACRRYNRKPVSSTAPGAPGRGACQDGPMPDDSFLARVRTGGKTLWHVQQGRRFIGTIVEIGGRFEATRLPEGAALTPRLA